MGESTAGSHGCLRTSALVEHPPVSILVPCHNEEAQAEETFGALARIDYPDFEIVAINDGSTDRTAEILDSLATRIPNLRVVHDMVSVTDEGVIVNGKKIPNSKPLDRDLAGRVLPRLRITERRLIAGEVFLLSDVNPRSFDGRYFGPTRDGAVFKKPLNQCLPGRTPRWPIYSVQIGMIFRMSSYKRP